MPPALERDHSVTQNKQRGNRIRRAGLAATALIAFAAPLLAAPAALASILGPESGGSPNADAIHSLYTIIFVMAIIVFIAVEGALLYAVIKFRASKGAKAAADPWQHAS